jgi:hypothetical protein
MNETENSERAPAFQKLKVLKSNEPTNPMNRTLSSSERAGNEAGLARISAMLKVKARGVSANGAQEPPELAATLERIHNFLRRFVAFSSLAQLIAIALWIVHT